MLEKNHMSSAATGSSAQASAPNPLSSLLGERSVSGSTPQSSVSPARDPISALNALLKNSNPQPPAMQGSFGGQFNMQGQNRGITGQLDPRALAALSASPQTAHGQNMMQGQNRFAAAPQAPQLPRQSSALDDNEETRRKLQQMLGGI
jgi:hypothetical protein